MEKSLGVPGGFFSSACVEDADFHQRDGLYEIK